MVTEHNGGQRQRLVTSCASYSNPSIGPPVCIPTPLYLAGRFQIEVRVTHLSVVALLCSFPPHIYPTTLGGVEPFREVWTN